MRVLSGTAIHGLKGISPQRGIFIRPLLCLRSDEIKGYLESCGIEWREDESNTRSDYTRNFVRNEIIPLALKRFPDISGALNRLSSAAAATLPMIDGYVNLKYGVTPVKDYVSYSFRADLLCGDRAAFYHLAAGGIRHLGDYAAANVLDEIYRNYSIPRPNAVIYSNSGFEVLKKRSSVVFRLKGEAQKSLWEYPLYPAAQESVAELKECGFAVRYKLEKYDPVKDYRAQVGCVYVSADGCSSFIIRSRRPGDRIRLSSGGKKIKDLMIDIKTDPEIRNLIPLIETEKGIAAYLQDFILGNGTRVAEEFMVSSSSKKVLAIYRGEKSYS